MLSRLVKFREEREGGFTLVELLVVIIIIGILAAIAIPVFLNQRQRANDAAVQSAVKSYVNAAESYLVANPNATSLPIADIKTEGARLSTGVTILVGGDPTDATNGYTVCGWHSNGKSYKNTAASGAPAGTAYVYRSGQGTYTGAACPVTPAAAAPLNYTSTN